MSGTVVGEPKCLKPDGGSGGGDCVDIVAVVVLPAILQI